MTLIEHTITPPKTKGLQYVQRLVRLVSPKIQTNPSSALWQKLYECILGWKTDDIWRWRGEFLPICIIRYCLS